MGAKLGRRFLKQPAEKLKSVFVAFCIESDFACLWYRNLFMSLLQLQLVLKPSSSIVSPSSHILPASRVANKTSQGAAHPPLLRPPACDVSDLEPAPGDVKPSAEQPSSRSLVTVHMQSSSLATATVAKATSTQATFRPKQQMTLAIGERAKPLVFPAKTKPKLITIDAGGQAQNLSCEPTTTPSPRSPKK